MKERKAINRVSTSKLANAVNKSSTSEYVYIISKSLDLIDYSNYSKIWWATLVKDIMHYFCSILAVCYAKIYLHLYLKI